MFEGMDKAGKTTQRDHFRALPWADPAPQFVHMPSGLTPLTTDMYRVLESVKPQSELARQLLHLACHAENVPAIRQQRQQSAVVLDRFWWSTVAYGWHGGRIGDSGLGWDAFMSLIDSIWAGLTPDLVFLFMNAYKNDSNNSGAVEAGYRELADEFSDTTVFVPRLSAADTSNFVYDELVRRGLAA